MTERTRLPSPPRAFMWLMLALILLVALFLRTYELDRFPRGPFSDEAVAFLLASQVASGHAVPIFITAYTGHEVAFYYLAVPLMRLLGSTIFALRLTSALIGVATVLVTFLLARELFNDEPAFESHWLGLLAATLLATSFWHVSVSRYGYRAITLPLIQSLMLLALWRGVRRKSWRWIIAAGIFCGLVAYTYLASRSVPIALAILLVLALIAERKQWQLRLRQFGSFVLIALGVFAPLGIFFFTHPETFTTRMTQVSPFSEGNAGLSILIRNTLRALQVFTLRGDPSWRFNLPNLAMFEGPLALAFYIGLIVIAVQLVHGRGFLGRVRYALIVVWILVMLLPTILADPVDVPHSLRAIGVLPLAVFVPSLGLIAVLNAARRMIHSARVMVVLAMGTWALTLGTGAINTFQEYFVRWAPEPRLYYELNQDVADLTRYLDSLPDEGQPMYVGALDYRHPTAAAVSKSYSRIKWVQGNEAFVFSPGPAIYAWPRSALPDDWWLARFFPVESRLVQPPGPDGEPAYVVHSLDHLPAISPGHPLSATFGGVIQAIGYDILRDRPSGGRTDVAMYWRILRKPERGDYSEFITLSDSWGIQQAQGGSFAYPSEQWSPGEILAERVRIQTSDGTPPGQYIINVGWWSSLSGERLAITDAQGRFAGTTVAVSPITVTRRTRPLDVSAVGISQRVHADLDGLTLVGFDQWPSFLRQGEPQFLTLYWQASHSPLPDRRVTLQMRSDQRLIVLSHSGPVHGTYPTTQWEKDEFIADRLALRIPPDTPAGTYTLEAQVDDFPVVPLGRVDVHAIARNWIAPATSHPMSLIFGSQVALVGYEQSSQILAALHSAPPGSADASNIKSKTVELTLHWQALQEMSESYTVFVHLVDESGAIRAQKDNAPANGTYPTTLWQPGEFVNDVYTLALSPDVPPGDYTLEVGLYLADTGARLPIVGDGDRVVLTKVSAAP